MADLNALQRTFEHAIQELESAPLVPAPSVAPGVNVTVPVPAVHVDAPVNVSVPDRKQTAWRFSVARDEHGQITSVLATPHDIPA
jgi:hypothetical protein